MATAEGVKNKIQDLIENVNGKTGKSDPDLTTAVNSLIEKAAGVSINGTLTKYNAGAPVTAGDFVELTRRWGVGKIDGDRAAAVTAAALSETKVLVAYVDKYQCTYARVLSVEGTKATAGIPLQLTWVTSYAYVSASALDANRVLLAYGDVNAGCFVVLTVNGTDVTAGEPFNYGGSINACSVAVVDTDLAIAVSRSTANAETRRLLSITGSTVSMVGTVTNSGTNSDSFKLVKVDTRKALLVGTGVSWTTHNNGAEIMETDGATIGRNGAFDFASTVCRNVDVAVLNKNVALVVYKDYSTSEIFARQININNKQLSYGGQVNLVDGSTGGSLPFIAAMDTERAIVVTTTNGSPFQATVQCLRAGVHGPERKNRTNLVALQGSEPIQKGLIVPLSGRNALLVGALSTAMTVVDYHTAWWGLSLDGDSATHDAADGDLTTSGTFAQPVTAGKVIGGVAKTTAAAGTAVEVYRVSD